MVQKPHNDFRWSREPYPCTWLDNLRTTPNLTIKVSPDSRQGFQNVWLLPPELLQSSRLVIIGRFDWCRFMTSSSKVLFSWGNLSCNQQSDPPRKVQHIWLLSSRTIPKSNFHNQLDLACGICCSLILWWRNSECNDQDVFNIFRVWRSGCFGKHYPVALGVLHALCHRNITEVRHTDIAEILDYQIKGGNLKYCKMKIVDDFVHLCCGGWIN